MGSNAIKVIIAGLFLLFMIIPLPTDPFLSSISLQVSPRVGFAPANIRVVVTVALDPDNRGADVILADGLLRARSWKNIDGEEGPRVWETHFTDIPSGSYEVKVILYGPGETVREIATSTVSVIESPREALP